MPSKLYNILNYSIHKSNQKPIYSRLDEKYRKNYVLDYLQTAKHRVIKIVLKKTGTCYYYYGY